MAETKHTVAIIAAMPREIGALTRNWRASQFVLQGRTVRFFEDQDGSAIAACAGMGASSARIAAESAWQRAKGSLRLFVSAGFAGALDPQLKAGDLVVPAEVVDDADGLSLSTASGRGKLVTSGAVATTRLKHLFAEKYRAQAVDMEAYAVGDVARIYGVPFLAIKAISDGLDFPMPPLGKWVTSDGRFRQGAFTFYSLFRPWTWPALVRLARNSARASTALALALQESIETGAAHYNGEKNPVQAAPKG